MCLQLLARPRGLIRGRVGNGLEDKTEWDTQFWALSLTVYILSQRALPWTGPSFFFASTPMVRVTRREDLVIYDEGGWQARDLKWAFFTVQNLLLIFHLLSSPAVLNWILNLIDPYLGSKPTTSPLMSQVNVCHIRSWNCPAEMMEREAGLWTCIINTARL